MARTTLTREQLQEQARNRSRLNIVLGVILILIDLFNYLRGGPVDTLFALLIAIAVISIGSGLWMSTPSYVEWRLRQAGLVTTPPNPQVVARRVGRVVFVVALLLIVEVASGVVLWSTVAYRGPILAALFPTAIFIVMMLVIFAVSRRKANADVHSPGDSSQR